MAGAIATTKRLRSSGFERTRGGYTFPGVSSSSVDEAAKMN